MLDVRVSMDSAGVFGETMKWQRNTGDKKDSN